MKSNENCLIDTTGGNRISGKPRGPNTPLLAAGYLIVFRALAGEEWNVFGFESFGFEFEPTGYVQSEPPPGKIKYAKCFLNHA